MKRYIKGVMPYLIIEVLLDIGATLMVAIVPYLQKLLFDVGISGGLSAVIKIAIAFALVHVLWVVFENVCMRFSWKSAIKFEKMLKRDFISSIFNMKSTEFYKRDIGEYISLQSNDITTLEQDYLHPMVDVIRSINMFIIYGIILFAFVDWRIAITILLASCLTVIGPKVTGEIMSQKRNAFQEQGLYFKGQGFI